MAGYAQGCHKCGGYPGSKTKDRSFLSECLECGTFTCNHHLTIMGHCPNCKSGKMQKVLTQRDVKKKASGGMPGAIRGKGGKKSSSNASGPGTDNGTASGASASGGGSASGGMPTHTNEELTAVFKRGGTETPRSSSNTGDLRYAPGAAAPENVKESAKRVLHQAEAGEKTTGQGSTSIPGVGEFAAEEISYTSVSETGSHSHIKTSHGQDVYENEESIYLRKGSEGDISLTSSEAEDEDKTLIAVQASASDDEDDNDENHSQAETSEKLDLDDPLADLFKEDKPQQSSASEEQAEEDNDESIEDDEDLTEIVFGRESMTPEELALIEDELQAAAKRRSERLSSLASVKRLQKMAELPLKDIPPMSDYADVLWGLTSTSPERDILAYEEQVMQIRKSCRENERIPSLLMGVVAFEPKEDLVLNKSVIGTIKSMEEIYCLIGYGPRTTRYVNSEKLEVQLKTLISSTDQVIGLGLLGLDMHYAPYTIEKQKHILELQLKLAAELNILAYISSEKADAELCAFIRSFNKENLPRLVYAGLIQSDEIAQLVEDYDMHVCLRPELSYESNSEALERTMKLKSVRWLPCSGMPHSAPAVHSGQWNQIRYIPDTINAFFASYLERRDPEEFMALVVSNWARLLFSEPLAKERADKEDLWADYDPNKKLF